MNRPVHSIKILNKLTNQWVPASIYEGFMEHNIEHYEEKWVPVLRDITWRVKVGLKPVALRQEDSHWNWRSKLSSMKGKLAFKEYAIECNGLTQGLMLINIGLKYSRIDISKPLVYVEYIQTAPWNRVKVQGYDSYKLVGSLLLLQAVGESCEEGFNGRIGLHALPKAEAFYRKIGLQEFGTDTDHQGLAYFELEESTSTTLMKNLGGR